MKLSAPSEIENFFSFATTMLLLLSLRFPLAAAVAALLVLGPRRCLQLTAAACLLLCLAWAALRWLLLRSPARRRRREVN